MNQSTRQIRPDTRSASANVDRKILSMFDELKTCSNLNEWETQFVESIDDQLSRGNGLSEAQTRKIQDIYERRIMGW